MKNLLLLLSMCIVMGLHAQCYTDRHSTVMADSWMSCDASDNPNTQLDPSHWIMYDLQQVRKINALHIWNGNLPTHPNAAISQLRIDYSSDGTSWQHWGNLDLDKPPAESIYEGQELSPPQPIEAKFVLLTSLSTYGDDCASLSEVRFNTEALSTATDDVSGYISSISLSPNPVIDRFHIHLTEDFRPTHYEIYSANGQLMIQDNYQNDVFIPNWPEGQYYIVVSGDQQRVTRSFTIIKPK